MPSFIEVERRAEARERGNNTSHHRFSMIGGLAFLNVLAHECFTDKEKSETYGQTSHCPKSNGNKSTVIRWE